MDRIQERANAGNINAVEATAAIAAIRDSRLLTSLKVQIMEPVAKQVRLFHSIGSVLLYLDFRCADVISSSAFNSEVRARTRPCGTFDH